MQNFDMYSSENHSKFSWILFLMYACTVYLSIAKAKLSTVTIKFKFHLYQYCTCILENKIQLTSPYYGTPLKIHLPPYSWHLFLFKIIIISIISLGIIQLVSKVVQTVVIRVLEKLDSWTQLGRNLICFIKWPWIHRIGK